MDIGIISSRYAKSLLAYATEEKKEERLCREMERLSLSYQEVRELSATLYNPVLDNVTKLELLNTAAGGDTSKVFKRFVQLVIKNGRLEMMPFIARSYLTLFRKQKNLTAGSLTVPVEISSKTFERLTKVIEKKTRQKVQFTVKVDPEIQGGFIIEYDTYRLDASLRTQLNQLRRQLCR